MAHMIPDTPPGWGPGKRAERDLYEALRERLDDEFFVYHSLPLFVPKHGKEGEIDFLVLHREHGMLVIECKGEGVSCDGKGQWKRCDQGAWKNIDRGPLEQAQDQVHCLADILEGRMGKEFPSSKNILPFTYGYAAAFPRTRLGELGLPLSYDRGLLIDAEDLGSIDRRVMRLMAHWEEGRRRQALSKPEFKRFRKQVLHPPLKIAPTLGGSLLADEQVFIRLSDAQLEVIEGLLNNHRLAVIGGAGTGKTVLAMEAVRLLSEKGARVLFLCFNRALGDHVEDVMGVSGDGSVTARNFHRLCFEAADELKLPLEVPEYGDDETQRVFWEETAPERLLDAIDKGAQPTFDAVIVDEGQDFAPDWWAVIEELLTDSSEGRLAVFHDTAQNIFDRPASVPKMETTYPLKFNFRNTRRICERVRELGRVTMEPHPRCPEGEPPVVYPQESPGKTLRKLEELVQKLIGKQVPPERITLLTPHSRERSVLAGVETLADQPLAKNPADRAGQLLHTTIGKFKGLESDVLILLDVDPDDLRCSRNARYVAASRARQVLYVFTKGDWLRD